MQYKQDMEAFILQNKIGRWTLITKNPRNPENPTSSRLNRQIYVTHSIYKNLVFIIDA